MCETLPTTTPIIPNYLSFGKYIINSDKSITQPDNGHKADSKIKVDFKLESERLKTFKNWKNDVVLPEDLVKAGFYSLNNSASSDLVKCAFCNAEICSWEPGDDALLEHLRWSPNCPYALEKSQTSSSKRTLAFLRSQSSGQDVCGSVEMFSNSIPESETFRRLSNMVTHNDDEKVRLESFANWPKTLNQKPEVLAEAGFYYRGMEDQTVCFSCGGALKDWKLDDDPWEQHALWFPRCKHVLLKKGPDYVNEIQKNHQSTPSSSSLTKEESEEPKSVSEQGHKGEDILHCKICNSNERNVIFIPCKHILACDECSRQFNDCPVCRKPIEDRMKVFLS